MAVPWVRFGGGLNDLPQKTFKLSIAFLDVSGHFQTFLGQKVPLPFAFLLMIWKALSPQVYPTWRFLKESEMSIFEMPKGVCVLFLPCTCVSPSPESGAYEEELFRIYEL